MTESILFIFQWIHTASYYWCNVYLICQSKQMPDAWRYCNGILNDITDL
jgi:hypothetical protein